MSMYDEQQINVSNRKFSFGELPDDILLDIASYCDSTTLCRLSMVSRRFRKVFSSNCIWNRKRISHTIVGCSNETSVCKLNSKEKYRIELNIKKGKFKLKSVLKTKEIHLPWLQSNGNRLWMSLGSEIIGFQKIKNGCVREDQIFRGHNEDVTRFVCKDEKLYSVSRDKSMACFNASTADLLWRKENCHAADILCISVAKDTICTGSEDGVLKIWKSSNIEKKVQFNLNDRILSNSFIDDHIVCGTSYLNYALSPLTIWNLEKEILLGFLGSNNRKGAGILAIRNYDDNSILTGGYDTYVRFWDTRSAWTKPILEFSDPFDSFVYSLQTDGDNAIAVGLSNHARISLWDRRYTKKPMQYFFTVKRKTPVFSLELDYRYTYVAIDRGLYLMDFD
ncbi:DgyrCDS10206 [Dimorphilus gyrociliatus]|uniref:DgyrCDS10206 n=1 Tax=Dimorphilus gyrociliatus TaxID=2664684 RepID=A0A7I8W0X0_9ANNE|nr:DgyrCDS10206 [Dimorphilus gyrociliatus]